MYIQADTSTHVLLLIALPKSTSAIMVSQLLTTARYRIIVHLVVLCLAHLERGACVHAYVRYYASQAVPDIPLPEIIRKTGTAPAYFVVFPAAFEKVSSPYVGVGRWLF